MANKVGGKDSSMNNGKKSFAFGARGLDKGPTKVKYFIFVMAD
jgi:hypothetical protein